MDLGLRAGPLKKAPLFGVFHEGDTMRALMIYVSMMSCVFALAAAHAQASQLQSCRVHIVTKLDDSNIGNILSRAGAFVDGGLVRLDSADRPKYLLEMLKAGGDGQVVAIRPSMFTGDLILMQVTKPVLNQFQMTELQNVLVGYRIGDNCEQVTVQGGTIERCALTEISNMKSKLENVCRK